MTRINRVSFQAGFELCQTHIRLVIGGGGEEEEKSSNVLALLYVCLGKRRAVVDADTNVWIWCTATKLVAFYAPCGLYFNLDNTNSSIERGAGEKLFKVEGEDVGLVHHRLEVTVNHIADE